MHSLTIYTLLLVSRELRISQSNELDIFKETRKKSKSVKFRKTAKRRHIMKEKNDWIDDDNDDDDDDDDNRNDDYDEEHDNEDEEEDELNKNDEGEKDSDWGGMEVRVDLDEDDERYSLWTLAGIMV